MLRYPEHQSEFNRVPVRFVPEGSNAAIDMPFFRSDMLSDDSIQYSEYLKAYWLKRHQSSFYPDKIWIIYPDGRVDAVNMPSGPWQGQYYHPVRGGWLIEEKISGVSLLRNGQLVKILKGNIGGVAVSSSGCGVAVKIREHEEAGYRFKSVDVCKSGEKK
jgi:hypothetical protein